MKTNRKKIIPFVLIGFMLFVGIASSFVWTGEQQPVAYYKLDNSSGDAVDAVLGLNNATVDAGIDRGSGVNGILLTAYNFTAGTSESVDVTHNTDMFEVGNWTVSIWLNRSSSASNQGLFGSVPSGTGNMRIRVNDGGSGTYGIITWETDATAIQIENSTLPPLGVWQHFVLRANGTDVTLHLNGTEVERRSYDGTTAGDSNTLTIGQAAGTSGSQSFGGLIDEVGIWNRSLSDSEITELYNSGAALAFGSGSAITTALISPANSFATSNTTLSFNATITPTSIELTNATINVWNSTLDVYNQTTNFVNGTVLNSTLWDISFAGAAGDYTWNVLGCANLANGSQLCSFADTNRSFSITQITTVASEFNASALETSQQIFSTNITLQSGLTVAAATLIYNGTEYTGATKTEVQDLNWTLSRTINIPIVPNQTTTQNITFQWNITTQETATGIQTAQSTSLSEQNVSELVLNLCNLGSPSTLNATHNVLNFTLKDELTGLEINDTVNATTFQGTFTFGAHQDNLMKNFSINNQSRSTQGDGHFNFCTNNQTRIFYTDLNSFYDANDYTGSNHFLDNATLRGNNSNAIDLFLLNDATGVQFFIEVKEDLVALPRATVQVSKFFTGEGIYKTVEIDQTGNDGKFTAFLELDKQYRFTVIKEDGTIAGVIDQVSICEAAPCEITLEFSRQRTNIFKDFDAAFADNVAYNLSFNPNTEIVTFDFVDISGLATSFNMEILKLSGNATGNSIFNKSVFTSSGSMTANLTNQTDGDYRVNIYISRSPNVLIDFLNIVLSDFAKDIGLLGLFIAMILIFAIIFGMAISAKTMIIIVPLALTLTKFMGFAFIGATSLVVIWVLAIVIALAVMR